MRYIGLNNLILVIFVLLATTVASNAQTTATTDTTQPANISWYAPLRYATVNLTDGVPYLVFFTPSPRITFEAIDLYQDCDGVQGTLVMHLGAVNVSAGNFRVNIYSTLSPTVLYCFEMSDASFWYNSPPFYTITAPATSSAVTVTSTAIIETVASQSVQSISATQSLPTTAGNGNGNGNGNGTSTQSQSSGLSTAAIGGIAAGGGVLLIGAFLFGWCFRRSKTTKPDPPIQTYTDPQMGQANPYSAYPPPRAETVYSTYGQPAGWGAPPPANDPNYQYNNFAPAPPQKSQGGSYAQPLTPAELENIYARPPYAPVATQYPQQPPSHGYGNASPPPFHTVLKPFDPEIEQPTQVAQPQTPQTPLTGYIQVPQTPEQRQRVPDANV